MQAGQKLTVDIYFMYRHKMSKRERKSYIDAELCLLWQKPSRTDIPFTQSLYDDLLGTHQVQMWSVHWTVSFQQRSETLMIRPERADIFIGIFPGLS